MGVEISFLEITLKENALIERLKGIQPKSVVLLHLRPEIQNIKVACLLLRLIESLGLSFIYVTTNRSGTDIIKRLSRIGCDLSKHIEDKKQAIVDATGLKSEDRRGIFYVSNPGALSDLSMKISSVMREIRYDPGKNWVVLDSVSTLLVYNSIESALQFLHTMIGKIRVQEFFGIIFAVKGGIEDPIIATVMHYCDESIVF